MSAKNVKLPSVQVSVVQLQKTCGDVCLILKAMSHPQRLMILGHLLSGEKTVTELVELTGITQSQMSQFLVRMRIEGLIEGRRQGRFQYYSVTDLRIAKLVQTIQNEFCGHQPLKRRKT